MSLERDESLLTTELTADEFEAMPDTKSLELVNGYLREKKVGAESGSIAGRIYSQLERFCLDKPVGHPLPADIGFRCFPGRPKHVRKPDAAFIRFGRLPGEKLPKGDFKIAPNLAVEVVSPNDLYEELEDKIMEYRSAGVELIWVISPTSRRVLIRRLDGSASEVPEDGELSGEGVVPGFKCAVREFFRTFAPPA
jgi:Uma2 family endonuclease